MDNGIGVLVKRATLVSAHTVVDVPGTLGIMSLVWRRDSDRNSPNILTRSKVAHVLVMYVH